jgi:hypothetical protein
MEAFLLAAPAIVAFLLDAQRCCPSQVLGREGVGRE